VVIKLASLLDVVLHYVNYKLKEVVAEVILGQWKLGKFSLYLTKLAIAALQCHHKTLALHLFIQRGAFDVFELVFKHLDHLLNISVVQLHVFERNIALPLV
jgi:hypothetical protein